MGLRNITIKKGMKNVVFLNFSTFEKKGGIETVNKSVCFILSNLSKSGKIKFKSYSLFDKKVDCRYSNVNMYFAFSGSKYKFIIYSILGSFNSNYLILSHINLMPIALIIKLINPSIKILLYAHGIEIWKKLPYIFLKKIYRIIAVSDFTKRKICFYNKFDPSRIIVIHNTLEPFFDFKILQNNYDENYKIITLARASFEEQYKGYDLIIEVLNELSKKIHNIKYELAGPIDFKEKLRIEALIEKYGVGNRVNLRGLIPSKDLTNFYANADLFVMPSTNEGFGIVFIESLACGTRIITSNIDGSREIVKNNIIGYSIDLNDKIFLIEAILDDYKQKKSKTKPSKSDIKMEYLQNFSFSIFENKFMNFLNSINL